MLTTEPAATTTGNRAHPASGEAPDLGHMGRLGDNPGFLAARFTFLAAGVANRALAEFGLRARSYSVLELATVGDGMSQRQIGQILCLDKSHIVRLVDEGVGRGLVGRFKEASDGRVTIVRATTAGRELADRASAALSDAYSTMLGDLSDADLTDAVRALRQLALRV